MPDHYWTAGYAAELVEPPDGGYSFVEWDDLSAGERLQVAGKGKWVRSEYYGVPMTILRETALGAHRVQALHYVLDELRKRKVASDEKTRLDAAQQANDRVVAKGMDKYLKADPMEIKAILSALEEGGTGREVVCDEPIPAYTCVWHDGRKYIRGVRPGNMSNAVTFTAPEETRSMDRQGNPIVVYRTKVFLK